MKTALMTTAADWSDTAGAPPGRRPANADAAVQVPTPTSVASTIATPPSNAVGRWCQRSAVGVATRRRGGPTARTPGGTSRPAGQGTAETKKTVPNKAQPNAAPPKQPNSLPTATAPS